jgi:hypothetical protein
VFLNSKGSDLKQFYAPFFFSRNQRKDHAESVTSFLLGKNELKLKIAAPVTSFVAPSVAPVA